jgi:hypothetical protein
MKIDKKLVENRWKNINKMVIRFDEKAIKFDEDWLKSMTIG